MIFIESFKCNDDKRKFMDVLKVYSRAWGGTLETSIFTVKINEFYSVFLICPSKTV